jgi:hypothetical protein
LRENFPAATHRARRERERASERESEENFELEKVENLSHSHCAQCKHIDFSQKKSRGEKIIKLTYMKNKK